MKNALNLLKTSEFRYILLSYISFLFVLGSVVVGLILKSKLEEDED